jgi:hypothetical protein
MLVKAIEEIFILRLRLRVGQSANAALMPNDDDGARYDPRTVLFVAWLHMRDLFRPRKETWM